MIKITRFLCYRSSVIKAKHLSLASEANAPWIVVQFCNFGISAVLSTSSISEIPWRSRSVEKNWHISPMESTSRRSEEDWAMRLAWIVERPWPAGIRKNRTKYGLFSQTKAIKHRTTRKKTRPSKIGRVNTHDTNEWLITPNIVTVESRALPLPLYFSIRAGMYFAANSLQKAECRRMQSGWSRCTCELCFAQDEVYAEV